MTSDDPPMPNVRWRDRSLLFLAAGGLLVVAGIATRDPTPLFLALPLLIAPAAAALGLPTGGRLTLRWDDRGRGRAVRLAVKLTPLDGPLAHPIDVSLTPPAPLSAPRPAEVRSTDP
ncbi:MAG TPA: hypothetical protein VGV64_05410, partial [Thermoplasmata archaeon]|nr:hypothetical protein [Thermoplasmata archaeon]